MIKYFFSFALFICAIIFEGCGTAPDKAKTDAQETANEIRNETLRTWNSYITYAWGYDELRPISKTGYNWYDESMYISPIDAFSTLYIMGHHEAASQIENFITDTVSFDKDIFVKTFEMNIRVLGGMLSMYDMTKNPGILSQAEDIAKRMLKAFDAKTGLPHYYINLHTGEARGDTVNVAEIGSFLLEMGVLSYYTENPVFYQTAKRAAEVLFNSRSDIGLIGQDFDVKTGKSLDNIAQIGCFTDSYYEYLYKTWLLFGDPDLKSMWETLIEPIHEHIALESDTTLWYGVVDKNTGELIRSEITLWDAYFPGLLAISGDFDRAAKTQKTWDWLWNQHGLVPMGYNFKTNTITNSNYHLNPEVIESAYYLWHFTGDKLYEDMIKQYWNDTQNHCRTEIAYVQISDVVSKDRQDQMSTYFFAENLKYFYLAFNPDAGVNPDTHVFSTEAHPFRKSNFNQQEAGRRLGF